MKNEKWISRTSSTITEPEAHDYTKLLLNSTSSCWRDIQKNEMTIKIKIKNKLGDLIHKETSHDFEFVCLIIILQKLDY